MPTSSAASLLPANQKAAKAYSGSCGRASRLLAWAAGAFGGCGIEPRASNSSSVGAAVDAAKLFAASGKAAGRRTAIGDEVSSKPVATSIPKASHSSGARDAGNSVLRMRRAQPAEPSDRPACSRKGWK